MQKVALIAVCWIALMTPVSGQESSADAPAKVTQAASDKAGAYEVVSIKPNKSEGGSSGMRDLPDGFAWTNVPLFSLVESSYGLILDSQVLGLPEWARRENYDIVAKVDAVTAERWKKLSAKERWSEERPMMRSILTDRCQFKGHEEARELPVYDLVIAKGGLKMKEAAPDEMPTEMMSGSSMTVRAMTIIAVVVGLSGRDGRIIVDKTGLGDRKFDFELKWSVDDDPRLTDDREPSLTTALEEELGLKLVPVRRPANVLIVEHMERPSPN